MQVTCTPQELHETGVWPVGRLGIYRAIAAGEIDVVRSGKRVAILCAPLRKRLGILDPAP
jgi:hypothetical protein